MQPLLITAFLLTTVSLGGVAMNELSHGEVAEVMGFGHRHMFDHGGYHCTSHDHSQHAQAHMQHMHEENNMTHGQCPGPMHDNHPMHPGGPQNG